MAKSLKLTFIYIKNEGFKFSLKYFLLLRLQSLAVNPLTHGIH